MIASITSLVTTTKLLHKAASNTASKLDLLGNRRRAQEARLIFLRNKYGDEALAQKLMQGQYWVGQSSEQLRDALGPPVAVDDKLLKTIQREVWKYNQHGKNRYRLRITVEDSKVVGWDHKA